MLKRKSDDRDSDSGDSMRSSQRPLVSICLPNLNTRPYLVERMESILSQTLTNWELIIVDDYSTDGAWELFQEYKASDPRISLFRGPREGLYPGWNDAIRRAKGEFVYIATSDDTMATDCLEKLARALSSRPDCDLAHCTLRTIDDAGDDVDIDWYKHAPFLTSSGPLKDKPHIRFAPFDGLLHLLGSSVYVSVTQLLFRTRVFTTVGEFDPQWGTVADFNFMMRASLVCNTIHVPDTWGGWRLHANQATKQVNRAVRSETIERMIDAAIERSMPQLSKPVQRKIGAWRNFFRDRDQWWDNDGGTLARIPFVISSLIQGNLAAQTYLRHRLGWPSHWNSSPPKVIQTWMQHCGIDKALVPVLDEAEGTRRHLPQTP